MFVCPIVLVALVISTIFVGRGVVLVFIAAAGLARGVERSFLCFKLGLVVAGSERGYPDCRNGCLSFRS